MCIKSIPSLTCSLIDWQTNVKHTMYLTNQQINGEWGREGLIKPKTFCNYSFNMMLENSWTQKTLCPSNVYQSYTIFSDKDIVHTSQYQPTNAIGEVCSKCVCYFCWNHYRNMTSFPKRRNWSFISKQQYNETTEDRKCTFTEQEKRETDFQGNNTISTQCSFPI